MLVCRFCLHGETVKGGYLPSHCSGCGREALWSTEEPSEALEAGYVFTAYDQRFMAALEIWGKPHFKQSVHG
jgi:hypothetical protein